ncbi:hypothetical protein B566_EDAN005503 [Ephemera danica]|nr:hypothetical protein B566_EDAN005503 [Ephemera danica]
MWGPSSTHPGAVYLDLPMSRMWQEVPMGQQAGGTSALTHGREALPLHSVRSSVRPALDPGSAHAHSQPSRHTTSAAAAATTTTAAVR